MLFTTISSPVVLVAGIYWLCKADKSTTGWRKRRDTSKQDMEFARKHMGGDKDE